MSEDYRGWRLPQLWAMVANETGGNATHHVRTLKRQQEALLAQYQRLAALRADLATKWPPEKSQAAAAFIDRLKGMAYAIEATVQGIGQVQENFRHITDALQEARAALKPLMDRYYDQSAAWHEVNVRQFPMLPAEVKTGIATLPGLDTLVLRYHQQLLDEQARSIMRATDQTVVEASTRMGGLPDYERINIRQDTQSGGAIGASEPQPFSTNQLGDARVVPPPAFNPPSVSPPIEVGPQPSPGNGAVLAQSTASGTLGQHHAAYPPMAGASGAPAGIAPDLPAMLPAHGFSIRTPSRQTVPRPGGVIGGDPSEHTARTSTAAHGSGPFPVTGITGMRGADLARARDSSNPRPTQIGRESPAARGVWPSVGGAWRDRVFEEYAERRRHPRQYRVDDPWFIKEGVPPVIDAPRIQNYHDPGPGVIGIDR